MHSPSDQPRILFAFPVKLLHAMFAGKVHLDLNESASSEGAEVTYQPMYLLQLSTQCLYPRHHFLEFTTLTFDDPQHALQNCIVFHPVICLSLYCKLSQLLMSSHHLILCLEQFGYGIGRQ